jgi:alpha-beta hydrolase superfamily lysophospholipase
VSDAAAIGEKLIETEGPFDGAGVRLYHRSVAPSKNMIARLAIVHGYGEHGGRYLHFMRWMAERGIACDAVDLRGQGRAEGRRGFVRRWEDYLDDLNAFLSLLHADHQSGLPLFLLAHSHGALIAAVAGESGMLKAHDIRGVIMTSPYLRNRMAVPLRKILLGRAVSLFVPWTPIAHGMAHEWMTSDPAMLADSAADPLMTSVATPRWYLGHLRAQRRVLARASEFQLPLLVLAAGDEKIADPVISEEFVRAAGSADKTFRLIPEMRHELLRETGREKLFAEIRSWIFSQDRTREGEPTIKPNLARK